MARGGVKNSTPAKPSKKSFMTYEESEEHITKYPNFGIKLRN
jgi:hypothetical protein